MKNSFMQEMTQGKKQGNIRIERNLNATSCPLCSSDSFLTIRSISPQLIFSELEKNLHVSFPKHITARYSEKPFVLCECCNCHLQYFQGLPCGSEEFYEICASSPSYYSQKWEFDAVLNAKKFVCSEKKCIDIGAGSGAFLIKATQAGLSAIGLEYNKNLVAEGRKNAVSIFAMSAKEYKETTNQQFDIVTCFHVLEHVNDPVSFMKDILDLLKLDGILFIAVPFRDSLICRNPNNVMDCPPHHVTRWAVPQMEYLCNIFKLEKCFEQYDFTLQGYHIREALLHNFFHDKLLAKSWLLDRFLAIGINRYTEKFWCKFHKRLKLPVFHSMLMGFQKGK